MKTTIQALAVCFMLACTTSIARADGIDFSGSSGGQLSFNPEVGQSLTVSNAPINLLWALHNPNVTYSLSANSASGVPGSTGVLNFTTGVATQIATDDSTKTNYSPFCGYSTCASFGAGGSSLNPDLTITGSVYSFDSTGHASLIASGDLLSGAFLSGSGQFGANGQGFLGGSFNITSLNPNLMSALFGVIPQGSAAGTIGQVLFNITLDGSGNYVGTVGSTNIEATIPEPAGLLLLGTGLLFGGGLLRKLVEKKSDSQHEGLL